MVTKQKLGHYLLLILCVAGFATTVSGCFLLINGMAKKSRDDWEKQQAKYTIQVITIKDVQGRCWLMGTDHGRTALLSIECPRN